MAALLALPLLGLVLPVAPPRQLPRAEPGRAHHPAPRARAPRADGSAGSTRQLEADELMRLREGAAGWLGFCSAISLSDGKGLQPFASPIGWLADYSPPPAQAYTQLELMDEILRHEPSLNALLDACAHRAPSLCTVSSLLPLARLAAWTSDHWVRPLDEWQGEVHAGEDDVEAATLRSLVSHLLERWETPEVLHGALNYRRVHENCSMPPEGPSEHFLIIRTLWEWQG